MHRTQRLRWNSVGVSNWTTLLSPLIIPLTQTELKNTTAVTTRFLRFSMYQSINASVNEVFIFSP
jgi:hypothetical protein